MTNTRPRRIVRRAVMTLVGIVLLIGWYVGAWLAVGHAEAKTLLSCTAVERIQPAFVPIIKYCESALPGSVFLERVWWKANPPTLKPVSTMASPTGVLVQWSPIMPPIPPED